jgi:hypothetical protein
MPVAIEYFSDDNYKYSTALMFSYINLYKPKKTKMKISDLLFNLEFTCWENKIRPIDVIKDIKNKKYKKEVERINNVDTRYPIIVDSKYRILDGCHRCVKQILSKKSSIDVYIFNESIMKKFIIAKRDEPVQMSINDFIDLFIKRFIKNNHNK